MGLSVSTSMGFENRELFQNSAQNLAQSSEKTVEKTTANNSQLSTVLTNYKPLTTEQYLLLASTQITVNNSLKETLKYLQNHAIERKKEYRFGDLWKMLYDENDDSDEKPYDGILLDIVIDLSKNIFAA